MTRFFVSTEVRLLADESGAHFATHNAARYAKWAPFRNAFGQMTLVGRVRPSDSPQPAAQRADGPGVEVAALPYYHGLKQLVISLPRVWRAINKLGDRDSVFVGRLPEPLALLLYVRSRRLRARYVSLVVSEPRQLGDALLGRVGGAFLGSILAGLTRMCVRHSSAVVYVTQKWLQSIYPAPRGVPTLGRSNVVLAAEAFAIAPRTFDRQSGSPLMLVTVSTLQSPAKGIDILLRTVSTLSADVPVHLDLIGGGRLAEEMSQLANSLGIAGLVRFHGHVDSPDAIRDLLDASDIYVSPSRAEGLPRAVVEAMARGLPVVATDAGGSSELVDPPNLVPTNDAVALASAIRALASNNHEMTRLSEANIERAQKVADLATDDLLTDFLVRALSLPLPTLSPSEDQL